MPRCRAWMMAAFLALLAPGAGWAGDEVRVPVILPLTGLGAFLGQGEREALEIMQGVVNRQGGIGGRMLRFQMMDDRSVPQDSVQLMTGLMPERPAVVLGSAIAGSCGATAPLLRQGPVQYCFSPAVHPPPGSFMFTAGVSSGDTYRVVMRYFRLRGFTRIGFLASTDATGQDGERAVEAALKLPENAAMRLAGRQSFNPADLSVAAQLETIRAASPEALMVATSGTPLGTVLKGLVQAGMDLPTSTLYSNMTFAQMEAYAAFLPSALYFPSGQWPRGGKESDAAVAAAKQEFYGAYQALGRVPDVGATLAWDPALIVVAALRAAGPAADAATLRATIAGMAAFPGLNGRYDFRRNPQRGLDESDVVIARWDKARHEFAVVSAPTGLPLPPTPPP